MVDSASDSLVRLYQNEEEEYTEIISDKRMVRAMSEKATFGIFLSF